MSVNPAYHNNWLLLTQEQIAKISKEYPLFDNFEVKYRGLISSKKELIGEKNGWMVEIEKLEIKIGQGWITLVKDGNNYSHPIIDLTHEQQEEVKETLFEKAFEQNIPNYE